MSNLQGFFFKPPFEENFWGHIIKEIYYDCIYEPYLKDKKDLTIFDIGANVGFTSYYFSRFAKKVYAFEPDSRHYEALIAMCDFNKLDNIIPIKQAVSNVDSSSIPFYRRAGNKTMNSLTPDVKGEDIEMVESIRLDTFFRQNNIDHVDLMKLDVEGHEAVITGGDGFANVAKNIDIIIGETHSWMDRNIQQFIDSFKENGFSYENLPQKEADATLFIARRNT